MKGLNRMSIGLVVLLSWGRVCAAEVEPVPVLWQSPACAHDKLGRVAIETGRRVNEGTQDVLVPSADYRYAFDRLAGAARERGANAVVLRWHKATYFTRSQKRSRDPVHIQLRGAAIHLHETDGACELLEVDPHEVRGRARAGEPIEVVSGGAYSD